MSFRLGSWFDSRRDDWDLYRRGVFTIPGIELVSIPELWKSFLGECKLIYMEQLINQDAIRIMAVCDRFDSLPHLNHIPYYFIRYAKNGKAVVKRGPREYGAFRKEVTEYVQ